MSENEEEKEEEEDESLGEPADWDWMMQQIDQAMSQGILQGDWDIAEHASLVFSDEYLSATCTKNGEEMEVEVMSMHGEYGPTWGWRSDALTYYQEEWECPATNVIAVLQRVEREVLASGATF